MKIYRGLTEIYDIRPEDSSTQRVVHMGDNVLNLTFRTTSPLDLRVNDFVVFSDEKYKFKTLCNPTRRSRYEYEYSCKLFAPQYDLEDALYVLEDSTGAGILDDTIPIFGTASFHLQQIVECVNAVHPEWEVGDAEEPAEGKNIVYTDMDCLQALQHMCGEFNIEYWITGTTISLGKKKYGDPILFKYGKGNALYDLSRTNQDGRIVTKLLVKGSDRNIDSAAYGSKYLHLPNGERYVTQQVDKFGVIMGRMSFPDVFPRLIHQQATDPGAVTDVRVDDAGIYWLKDSHLNFSPELLPGKNLVVDFRTGQLGGLKIDANWHEDTQEYELIRGDYGLGQDVPGSVFIPAVGDLYLLSDLKMPQAYIEAAEEELLEKAQEAIGQMCEQKVSYKGSVNPLFFRQLGERIETGRAVTVEDAAIVDGTGSVELRVQAFTCPVNDDLNMDIEISDTLYVSRVTKIENALKEVKADTNERINYGDAYARRRWRDSVETSEALKEAQLNFSDAISPIAVQAMQLLVGDQSLQFRFVTGRTSPVAISYAITYNKATKRLYCPTTILQHMTLGIGTVSSAHVPSEYKFWNMTAFDSGILTESAKKYYLYAKVSKTGTTGTFLLNETSIAMEGVANYYHLLVGVLNSEYEGDRSFARLYGFTEILPGRIFTEVLSDPNRNTVFDLVTGLLNGIITFKAGTSGYDNITDKRDIAGAIGNASTDLMTYINGAFSDGIADEVEVATIKSYLKTLQEVKTDIDARYTALYGNATLSGTAKSNLYNAKSSLDTYYTSLVSVVNSAVSDGKITDAEKNTVDYYYTYYKSALSTYSTRYEEAHNYVVSQALNAAEAAGNAASGKATVYYNTSASYVPAGVKTNDLLCTGAEIYRWNGSAWVLVSEFYNTKTVINGGLISTGALIVGSSASAGEGGMAGGGTIRIWSGGTVTSGTTAPSSATFTVDKDGVVSSKNSFIVYDANGRQAAGFTSVGTNWGSDNPDTDFWMERRGSLRMWIGGEYASRDNACFKVYTGGIAQMSGFMVSNVVNPSSSEVAGIFGSYDLLKINSASIRCKGMGSSDTRSSLDVNNNMLESTVTPYVDIQRPSSTSYGTCAVAITAKGVVTGSGASTVVKGGVACLIKGGMLHFDIPVVNVTTDQLWGNSNVFLFTGSDVRTKYLPSQQLMDVVYGYVFYASFELTVIQHTGSSGTTTIKGESSAPLLNNNGGYMGGSLPGEITLSKGDCMTFRYVQGGWYITSAMT